MTRAEFGIRPSDQVNIAFTGPLADLDSKLTNDWYADYHLTTDLVREMPPTLENNLDKSFFVAPYSLSMHAHKMDLIAPVGEYGEEWAATLINATARIGYTALIDPDSPQSIQNEIKAMGEQHTETIFRYTDLGALSAHEDEDYEREEVIENATTIQLSGFRFVLGAAAWATFFKQPGYEDNPEKLLKDVVSDGVLSTTALSITPGDAQYMLDYHVVPKNLLVSNNGRFSQNAHLTSYWNRLTKKYPNSGSSSAELLERRGCPLGRKLPLMNYSGVDMSGQMLVNAVSREKFDFPTKKS